jgi:hypothetical protein
LLYQLMVHAFELSYIPNIANTFYMCPIFATAMGRKFKTGYQSNFESGFGYEKGYFSPSEGGNVWNRWFPHEKKEGFNYTPKGFLPAKSKHQIRQIIAHHERIFQSPFINKNVKMSVRLQAIKEMFPDALLIQIKRNPLDAVLSLLMIRRKRGINWWSVLPKEYDRIKNLPDVEQVTNQVIYTEKNIGEDIRLFDCTQAHTVYYNALCRDPQTALEDIYNFLTKFEIKIHHRQAQIPPNFNISKPDVKGLITSSEIKKIENILAAAVLKE